MFLRSIQRKKDGKSHRYFSVVENRRLQSGRVAQRRVLYLGEINDSQQEGWRKTLEIFDEVEQRYITLSLFPEDRTVPGEAVNSVTHVRLTIPQSLGAVEVLCEIGIPVPPIAHECGVTLLSCLHL